MMNIAKLLRKSDKMSIDTKQNIVKIGSAFKKEVLYNPAVNELSISEMKWLETINKYTLFSELNYDLSKNESELDIKIAPVVEKLGSRSVLLTRLVLKLVEFTFRENFPNSIKEELSKLKPTLDIKKETLEKLEPQKTPKPVEDFIQKFAMSSNRKEIENFDYYIAFNQYYWLFFLTEFYEFYLKRV